MFEPGSSSCIVKSFLTSPRILQGVKAIVREAAVEIMAKGPGGRTANDWTSSRNRKLVRLYTLTQLTKKEIRKALKAKDFDPW